MTFSPVEVVIDLVVAVGIDANLIFFVRQFAENFPRGFGVDQAVIAGELKAYLPAT